MRHVVIILVITFISCEFEKITVEPVKDVFTECEEFSIPLMNDTTIELNYLGNEVLVDINYPSIPAVGTMLVLQGWNFPRTDWCDSTSLCEKALNAGFVLVCPEMGKSIYHLRTYPETRKDWLRYPTKSWIDSTMIVSLQAKFNLFLPESKNVVVGLSTGARGAFVLALDSPGIFDGAACLSGDYDMTLTPNDNLYRGYYGELDKNYERWGGDENPVSRIASLETPIYLSHGAEDKIVDPSHSLVLYDLIKKKSDTTLVEFRMYKKSGHNYRFWNSEVDSVLNFFSDL